MEALAERNFAAQTRKQTFALVIDEADLVSSRAEIMEPIRGISDLQLIPTILVGMGKLRDNLRRFPQIESRAPNRVNFTPATLQDAQMLFDKRCEVPVEPELVRFAWEVSRGFNREILADIADIESIGRRLDLSEGGVALGDMAGRLICHSRDSGAEILVPEAVV